MTRRVVYIDRPLVHVPEPDRSMWWRWLERMGVDPNSVPIACELIIDDDHRRISWDGWQLDDLGRVRLTADRQHIVRQLCTVQLEAPALPVPAGYRVEEVG